mgnify:CR=1 FL=1
MTKLETSFFSKVCHRFSILYRDIIPTVHWSSIRAVTRCWCQVTGATNICVDNLRVAERKMWRSCQLRRENKSEEWLRWPWLLTSEDGYPEPAEHRGLDTRGWRDTNTITTYLVHDLEYTLLIFVSSSLRVTILYFTRKWFHQEKKKTNFYAMPGFWILVFQFSRDSMPGHTKSPSSTSSSAWFATVRLRSSLLSSVQLEIGISGTNWIKDLFTCKT